jgi:hypothetical protein
MGSTIRLLPTLLTVVFLKLALEAAYVAKLEIRRTMANLDSRAD